MVLVQEGALSLHTVHSLGTCPVRSLSCLAGLLIARAHSLGPATSMRTRAIYSKIEAWCRSAGGNVPSIGEARCIKPLAMVPQTHSPSQLGNNM